MRPQNKPTYKIGFSFSIVHVDGVTVNEVIAKVTGNPDGYYYVCNSCACYGENEIKEATNN